MDLGEREDLERGRAKDPLVKVEGLAYVLFERPSLARIERFLNDFGLKTVSRGEDVAYLRGTAASPFCYKVQRGARCGFIGYGMVASEVGDLERLSRLPEASPVEPIDDPGGGHRVRLAAPHGFEVHVIHGHDEVEPLPLSPPLPVNTAEVKVRTNLPRRPPQAPSEVHRLGHVVIGACHFRRVLLWHLRTLGMIVSDYQRLDRMPEAGPVLAFLRCDRGETPTDHHTVAIVSAFANGFAHAAFEVQDLDALAMGAQHLSRRGYERAWGIGRHTLGSQLFDYWRDPDGFMHEHYADGDLFDISVPTGFHPFGIDEFATWGPPAPHDFVDGHLSPSRLRQMVEGLRHSEDLSVRKLIEMKRALTPSR